MTIKDLAAQTGYSVGTISRVLNGQPHVSESAKAAILRAAEESGFQLNVNAKQLKQQRGSCLLAICKGTVNGLFNYLLLAMQSQIEQAPYPLVVDYIDENDNEIHRAIQLCLERKPLGIFFLGGNWDHFVADFHKITVPSVLITYSAQGLSFSNLSSVTSDDFLAGKLSIDYLVSRGHRNIAVIGGNWNTASPARSRYDGCMQAFREHGISFDPELDYAMSRYSFSDGYQAAKTLLQRQRPFTAVFAMSDVMAIGAIRALEDAGKRVPEDVSVMGLDGLTIGDFTVPRLTTVAQSAQAIAHKSVELLLQAVEQPTQPSHQVVPVTLLEKESVRTIKTRL